MIQIAVRIFGHKIILIKRPHRLKEASNVQIFGQHLKQELDGNETVSVDEHIQTKNALDLYTPMEK